MKPTIITAKEHYERLAESGHGRNDPPFMQSYMARWYGPQFYAMLGDLKGRDILEIGIGGGRIAREVDQRKRRNVSRSKDQGELIKQFPDGGMWWRHLDEIMEKQKVAKNSPCESKMPRLKR